MHETSFSGLRIEAAGVWSSHEPPLTAGAAILSPENENRRNGT
jgi:hypothetical protein